MGNAGHVVTSSKPTPSDKSALSVVEIVNGGVVQKAYWTEVIAGNLVTRQSVTTTGPGKLVAWWRSDASVNADKTVLPVNGLPVTDSLLLSGALVQNEQAL